jgi:channel protein (hemolysin III family)
MPDTHPLPGFADPVSSWTHLLGAAAFVIVTLRMLRRRGGDTARVVALLVLGGSSVFLLSMSGVYHLLEVDGPARGVLRQLDHSGIFVLIAGTLTAVHMILFSGPWRWGMIAVAWSFCAVGVVLKAVFFDTTPEALGLAIYLAMGNLGLITTLRLWWLHGPAFIALLLAGGLTYTVGAVLDFLRVPVLVPGVIGPHELFHVAVLVALALHWRFLHVVLVDEERRAGAAEGQLAPGAGEPPAAATEGGRAEP